MTEAIDLTRRFGGINRLYGDTALNRLSTAHAIVIGIGGVGSWAAEALARSGIGRLTLVDLDHVAESNFNRQLHAVSPSLGQAKVEATAQRIALINPGCEVRCIDDFLTPDNVGELIGTDAKTLVLDAMDQVASKVALIAWCKKHKQTMVTCGAAGGKLRGELVQVADLSETTQDPLLAKVRTGLRRDHRFPAGQLKPVSLGKSAGNKKTQFGIPAVYSTEAVKRPVQDGDSCAPFDPMSGAPLACAGYGSLVTVTAVFGMVAAGLLIDAALQRNEG
ncbi:MAG: Dinucleotide-utilizing enzymes involved in molybdopterin and thiamine biosynthesis family 1 [Fluviibacter phosphoraccumulans EoVTN8]